MDIFINDQKVYPEQLEQQLEQPNQTLNQQQQKQQDLQKDFPNLGFSSEEDSDGFRQPKFSFTKSFRNILLKPESEKKTNILTSKTNSSFSLSSLGPSSSSFSPPKFSLFSEWAKLEKESKPQKQKRKIKESTTTEELSFSTKEKKKKYEEFGNLEQPSQEQQTNEDGPPVAPIYTKEVQVCSDIHLDYHDIRANDFTSILKPCAPILILAGDVGNPKSQLFVLFLEFCVTRFKHVLFVAGNHEFHRNGLISTTLETLQSFESTFPNFHFLNNSSIEIEGYYFAGSTLWSNIPQGFPQEELLKIKDYRKIYKFTSQMCNQMHETSVSFLKREIQQAKLANRKIIIITHHAPLLECLEEQFVDDPLNICFVSNQFKLFQHPNVRGWIYGHTHYNYKREEGKQNVLAFLYANCYRFSNNEPYDPTGGPF